MKCDELSGLLFHGSNVKVSCIDLSKGVSKKDFGNGFYTTNSKRQAEKFAQIKAKRYREKVGYVSVFELGDDIDFEIKKFEAASLDWLNFVLLNRGFAKESAWEKDYDIIIGPVANDTVGLVLNQLIIGTYGNPADLSAKETAIRLLEPEKLYNQILFRTEKSIKNLSFKEACKVGIDG